MEKPQLLFGFGILLAFIFMILSGALYDTYWGYFNLIPYFLIPLLGAMGSEMDPSSKVGQFGFFFEAFLWVSTFGIPLVCFHVDAINGSQLAWLLVANVLVLASFIGLSHANAN